MREFKTYHPIVNFTYFLFVIGFSCVFMHPIALFISFVCSFFYVALIKGKKALKSFSYIFYLMIATALLNTLFNHKGMTILAYFPSGNPLTLESVIYGLASAVMVANILCWFMCFNEIIDSDKFLYLFAKIIPTLSLVLSMTLSFVPRLFEKTKAVINGKRGMSETAKGKGIIKKAKYGINILSAVSTWALENSIDTSDSMVSRGYGLSKRTSFSIYSFAKRDILALIYIVISGLYTLSGGVMKFMQFDYFKNIKANTFCGASFFVSFGVLCVLPIIIEIWEVQKWKHTESKI